MQYVVFENETGDVSQVFFKLREHSVQEQDYMRILIQHNKSLRLTAFTTNNKENRLLWHIA